LICFIFGVVPFIIKVIISGEVIFSCLVEFIGEVGIIIFSNVPVVVPVVVTISSNKFSVKSIGSSIYFKGGINFNSLVVLSFSSVNIFP
jgi:hypothetical protein